MRTGAAPSGLLRLLGSSTLRRVESPDGATYETGLIISQVDPEQCQCPCNCDFHRLGGRGVKHGCIDVEVQRRAGAVKLSRSSQRRLHRISQDRVALRVDGRCRNDVLFCKRQISISGLRRRHRSNTNFEDIVRAGVESVVADSFGIDQRP